MSMDNEANYQIDVELALHDVMDIICKYLSKIDLLNVAKVCKSWKLASLREEQKRLNRIQQLRLSFENRKRGDPFELSYDINHLASVVHVKPEVSLFVYEAKSGKTSIIFQYKLLDALTEQLPNKVMSMVVDEYISTEGVQFQGARIKGHYHLRRGYRDILGIFFPSGQLQISTHVAWIGFHDSARNQKAFSAKQLAEDLRLNECEYPKSTVLLITLNEARPNTIISEFGKRIQQSGKDITLAHISSLIVASESEGDNGNFWKSYVAIRISGRTVESWSTFIYYRARGCDIKCKLQALKEKVNKSKQHYIGLVWMPKCSKLRCSHIEHPCGNSHKMMRSLRRIFPYIRFTGFFKNCTELHTNPRERQSFPDVFNENGAYNPDFLDLIYLFWTRYNCTKSLAGEKTTKKIVKKIEIQQTSQR